MEHSSLIRLIFQRMRIKAIYGNWKLFIQTAEPVYVTTELISFNHVLYYYVSLIKFPWSPIVTTPNITVRTAITAVCNVKLKFISCSDSNHSVFYLCEATSVRLSSNPLLCTCISMKEAWLMCGNVCTLHFQDKYHMKSSVLYFQNRILISRFLKVFRAKFSHLNLW